MASPEITLFVPCFVDHWFPEIGEAVVEVVERLGYRVRYPEAQSCCGQFALTAGDVATAARLARHFLKVFAGSGLILCPSASCTLTVRRDFPALAASAGARREILAVTRRVVEFSEWLAAKGPLPWRPSFQGVLALHGSCKARELGALPAARGLLAQIPGLTLTSVSPYYSCCGFGGLFHRQHPSLARAIGRAYLEAVRATGATGLVSLDAGCFLHLKPVAQENGWQMDFYHLAELLRH